MQKLATWFMDKRRSDIADMFRREDGSLDDYLQRVALRFIRTRAEAKIGEFKISTLAIRTAIAEMSLTLKIRNYQKNNRGVQPTNAGDFRDKHGRDYAPSRDEPQMVEINDECEWLLEDMKPRWRDILLRRANGEILDDIAKDQGVSRQAINHLEQAAIAHIQQKLDARIPPGKYVSKKFPKDTCVIVCPDGRIVHRTASGDMIPMDIPSRWAVKFVLTGDWKRPSAAAGRPKKKPDGATT
ncbi:MAG: hypothetical protein IT428_31375 [Planctomycetaceae bacterium]|nr:hypothetical protein [Planctomycetaceae bacterium]